MLGYLIKYLSLFQADIFISTYSEMLTVKVILQCYTALSQNVLIMEEEINSIKCNEQDKRLGVE